MHKLFYILPIVLLAASCQSGSYKAYGERPTIADKTLMSVPSSAREDIDKARLERTQALDEVTLAKREVERAKERSSIAAKDVGIAKDEVDAGQERLELARSGSGADRNDRIQNAMKHLEGVRAHLAWTQAQVQFEEGRVEMANSKVAVAEQRVNLADARIELAKAEAVHSLEREDYSDVDVADFERCVAEQETELKMDQVDADASQKKMELRQDLLESRAKAVPASYRSSWKKSDEKGG